LLRCYLRPTLAVSFCRPRTFRPRLKAFHHGLPLRKSEEFAALQRCGIPVPRWALLREGERPDLTGFGDYVVTKPDRGARGADVKIRRASRLRWKAPETDQARNMERATSDLVVQEFIYTGRWPVSYRVVSLFGKVLFALRLEADHRRRPLESSKDFSGISIVSNTLESSYTLSGDEEIIEFGERAHAAFPEIPLLGIDIIRDCETGKLYVMEVNPDGWSWLFKSTAGRRLQEANGIDFDSQFQGIRKTALILIDRTRQLAR
jgi:glutathione synthase/RimK-type ligase-like ATP-grasp enzyme